MDRIGAADHNKKAKIAYFPQAVASRAMQFQFCRYFNNWLLFGLLAISRLLATQAQAKVVEFNFTISRTVLYPDCRNTSLVVVNGMSPGPPIHVNLNDILIVNVRNEMPDPEDAVTMHWHGFHQIGTLTSDGVPGVTQYPIGFNSTYRYAFKFRETPGTYFYHTHTKLHMYGAHGALIVHELGWNGHRPEDGLQYDEERTIVLSDFLNADLSSANRNDLANYVNRYGNLDANGPQLLEVEPQKTYRLRLINAGISVYQAFKIEGQDLELVEADGHLLKPLTVPQVELHLGQRYSALLRTNKRPASYLIGTRTGNETAQDVCAAMWLQYPYAPPPILPKSFDEVNKTVFNLIPEVQISTGWVASRLQAKLNDNYHPPLPHTREIIIDLRGNSNASTFSDFWTVNGVPFHSPSLPMILNDTIMKQPPSKSLRELENGYDPQTNTYPVQEGEVIQVVLQNHAVDAGGVVLSHPWHLHGHAFWDLGSGPGAYISSNSTSLLNTKDPILRDTTVIYSYVKDQSSIPGGKPVGWRVLRFVANNPGLWFSHCHIGLHHLDGMAFVFAERSKNNTVPMLLHSTNTLG
ncbi:uncharacterized protein VTP21DRAFT_2953 [Calcarisporiella thermophila]|uniref:uncharacterized protein n=1 Tax=Calcarisporiella thermophila TaxID=911321 RepID=UPI003742B7A6